MDQISQTTTATAMADATVQSFPLIDESGETDSTKSSFPVLFFERHSMLAYHFQSGPARYRGWQRIPLARIWYDLAFWSKQQRDNIHHCFHCQQRMLHPKASLEEMANQFLGNAIDTATGLLLGLLVAVGCWSSSQSIPSFVSSYFIEQQFLPEWLTWLESFPIGFKLNVALTRSIGQEIRSLVVLRQNILHAIAEKAGVIGSPLLEFYSLPMQIGSIVATTALGGSVCLALLIDFVGLLTVHLTLLSEGFRFVYSTELYLLGTMWRLFRGKKKNILRQRTDTMEYDSMQLLLGSILFVVTLFLLTTILVYHAFFTLLYLVVRMGTCGLLWFLYVMLQSFPYGTFFLRLSKPEAFISQVSILEDESCRGANTNTIITSLQGKPESLGSILSSKPSLRMRGAAFCSWVQTSVSEVLSGTPTSKTLMESLTTS